MTDPVAAVARTALSRQRTALGAAALAVLLLRNGVDQHRWVEVAAAAVMLYLAVLLWFIGRGARGRDRLHRYGARVRGQLLAVALSTAAAAVLVVLSLIG